ncbi:MAG: hypothetical protein ACREOW_10455 [Thermodesulfobacteriota bacterium]
MRREVLFTLILLFVFNTPSWAGKLVTLLDDQTLQDGDVVTLPAIRVSNYQYVTFLGTNGGGGVRLELAFFAGPDDTFGTAFSTSQIGQCDIDSSEIRRCEILFPAGGGVFPVEKFTIAGPFLVTRIRNNSGNSLNITLHAFLN